MTAGAVRPEAVAGAFYPGDAEGLREQLRACFQDRRGPGHLPDPSAPRVPRRTRALVVPHAGYVYSGAIAARAYERIAREEPPPEVLVLGVDHHGRGASFAVSGERWRTPLGLVPRAKELLEVLTGGPVVVDERAHDREHSIEVQLPFLQAVAPGVPVAMLTVRFAPFDELALLGAHLRRVLRERETLVIASTDFSHYVPAETARRLDALALARIEARDAPGLYETVVGQEISMCGIAPTTVLLEALGDEPLQVVPLGWGHSGEVERMRDVVGYAAMAFDRTEPFVAGRRP